MYCTVESEEKVLDDYIPKLSLNIIRQTFFKNGILNLKKILGVYIISKHSLKGCYVYLSKNQN